ncbi:hypothetical protein BKA61DRAFT_579861 [Leptodontidium sp. MPI-SDFR-AT-0119]|nr:hypothetical protein BKA61DRAFT_579861 [Leptodontidium sp. MPI-SDFR-AT-0119]
MGKGSLTCATLWIVACAVLGTSAAAIAKYGSNGITIAHLVLSIFTIFFIVFVANATDKGGDGSKVGLAIGFIVVFCIWLPLLILLVADPGLRPILELEEQQFANQTKKRGEAIRNVVEGPLAIKNVIEAPLSSGLYLGLALLDSAMFACVEDYAANGRTGGF